MPRKLEPGLAATYSKFSALSTSTMKSPPGRSVVSTSTSPAGSVSRGAIGAGDGTLAGGACAPAAPGTSAAAPAAALVAAALFRKSRRFTEGCFGIAVFLAESLPVLPQLRYSLATPGPYAHIATRDAPDSWLRRPIQRPFS